MVFAYFILALSAFTIVNAILHDVFVLRQHKGPYDRNLLRLLMDGHILFTAGVVYVVAYFLVKQNITAGLYLCVVASVSLIVYCLMIFPFLRSFTTLLLNVAMLLISLIRIFKHS